MSMIDENSNRQLKIEYMPLADLLTRFHPMNPKDHNIGQIAGSIDELDYRMPVMLDERSGLFAAGHGRTKALADMKRQQMKMPKGIFEDEDGEWLVPTIRGSDFTEEQLNAYLVADNFDDSGFDPVKLTELLIEIRNGKEVKLESTGYDDEDVNELLAEAERLSGAEAALSKPISNRDGLGDRKMQVKPVIYVDEVAVFERAIKATGQRSRGDALMEICKFYLGENEKGQLDTLFQNLDQKKGVVKVE